LTLRFASLGSGSRGNALLVESGDTLLMIDCGLPRRDVERRLRELGRSPRDVTAVLISHEHGDHVRGIGPYLRRYRTEIWSTVGTAGAVTALRGGRRLNCHAPLTIGAIDVEPFPVPHDAREPCQFVFEAGRRRLGLLTDTGHVTPHIRERLAGCDALAIELNHDAGLLHGGEYPPALKARIASRFGHLSNSQAAALLGDVGHRGLQWVAGLHLSDKNNTPGLARAAAGEVLDGTGCRLHLAEQDAAGPWLEIQ
jgi:phosphoribosyl 1,2-cyclic phosphodiesterase